MMTTSNKDLLELAAKAAGIEIVGLVDKMIGQPDHKTGGFIIRNDSGGDSCWNPLTDDGDALRLAVKLKMRVGIVDFAVYVWPLNGIVSIKESATMGYGIEEATRRAIVRAAAKIGDKL